MRAFRGEEVFTLGRIVMDWKCFNLASIFYFTGTLYIIALCIVCLCGYKILNIVKLDVCTKCSFIEV